MLYLFFFFFFKQKTAYEISSRDWSSDVCSSDLLFRAHRARPIRAACAPRQPPRRHREKEHCETPRERAQFEPFRRPQSPPLCGCQCKRDDGGAAPASTPASKPDRKWLPSPDDC